MPPAAAVHLRSPIHSSSMQNPNSIPDATSHPPFNHSAFSYANFPETAGNLNPSAFDNASGGGFSATFAPPGLSGPGSAASSRPRPRLVKLRKQSASQHARSRSRTATAEVSSGFNPFRSEGQSGSSDQVTGCVNASNGFMESSIGAENINRACNGGSSTCHSKFENTGFVFSAKRGEFSTNLNSQHGATAESGSSTNRGNVTIEKETEVRKSDHVEFIFTAKRSDVESNSSQERPKTSENSAKSVSGDEGKVGLDSVLQQGMFNSTEFVFCADHNKLDSNLNTGKGVYSKCVEKSGVGNDEERKCKTEAEYLKMDSFSFSFGDSQFGRTSNINVEKDPLDSTRKSNYGEGTFNPKTETISNSNSTIHDQDYHLNNDNKCESESVCTSSISSAFSTFPAYKLTDEMEKLNINISQKVGGADITRDLKASCVDSSTVFVFGRNEKATVSSGLSSGTNSDVQQSCPDVSLENDDGKCFKASKINGVQNETGCSIASGGISCSETSNNQESARDFYRSNIPECQVPEDSQVNGANTSFSFSSFGLNSHPKNHVCTSHSMSADQDKCDNGFTSIPKESTESFTGFKPPAWDPSCFKENLFPTPNKVEFTQKVRSSKERGSKQARRKLKAHSLNKKQTRKDHVSKGSSSFETPDSSGSYSPMDFSPYQETRADGQDVKASAELHEPSISDHDYMPSSLHSTIPTHYKDEHLAAVGTAEDNTNDCKWGDPNKNNLFSSNGDSWIGDSHSSGFGTARPSLNTEQVSSSSGAGAWADAGVGFSSNTDRKNSDQFCFASGLGNSMENHFTFSAPSTGEVTVSSFKPKQKKKYRMKVGCDSFVISPNLNEKFGSSVQIPPSSVDRSEISDQLNGGKFASSATIQEICEKWRLRGNQAYKDGDLSKAEDFYTLGINSVPPSERSGCWFKPLLLCYSNRAATRMGLGRIREALGDCLMAAALDPSFLKVQMRTANCYLLLGELEKARQFFNKCLESSNVVCLDRRVIVEAGEGLQRAQNVAECTNYAAELLKERVSDAAGTALELLSKALSISLYSEKLLQMKAEALCLLQKHDAVIQLCEQSLHLAEKNLALENSSENSNTSMHDSYLCVRLWRWSLISKCHFHLGRLETSLNILEKLQQDVSLNDKFANENIEDSLSLAATIRDLLCCKSAGNEHFKLGKYTEAIEQYTVALSSNIKSRPFAAVCFCNRAAAHQALGQIADAISDCSAAMALDGNYAKAFSRRATLHEMVRDYEQAACDLRRLLSILENQPDRKTKQSCTPGGSNGGVKELRQVRQHLLSVEDQAKNETPLDFYLILGVKSDDSATDVKKAYHKAALRHHPDKAGHFLARSEVGDEGQIWKEISQDVYKDADRLFKMIGEAYAVLSDPAKRSEYDFEEELRKAKQSNRGGTCRRSSDVYGFGRQSDVYRSSDRSSNRRQGRDHWKTYGNSYSRW
ncbi:DnaJ-like subfamily C member 7 [Senna tora]|uniref:DnaJ-like subfamily C member 7 n=1 Tax=Senna tora TaxID=362788 RepID=A0A834SIF5_9FABA|nr:DnaJ-like subfamily C member 7 [Senna tora]